MFCFLFCDVIRCYIYIYIDFILYHMLLRCIIYIYTHINRCFPFINLMFWYIALEYCIILCYIMFIFYMIFYIVFTVYVILIYTYIYIHMHLYTPPKKDRNVVHHYSSRISLFYQFLGCHIFLSCNDLFVTPNAPPKFVRCLRNCSSTSEPFLHGIKGSKMHSEKGHVMAM